MAGYDPHYIHEGMLKKAVGKLYMLGQRKRKDDTSFDEGMQSITSAGISANQAQQAKQALAKKAAEDAQKQRDNDVRGFHDDWSGGNNKYGMNLQNMPNSAVSGAQDPYLNEAEARRNTADAQQLDADSAYIAKTGIDHVSSNAEADKTRMGGVYSPNGLALTARDAPLNAIDRIRAKSTIGLGGSLRLGQ